MKRNRSQPVHKLAIIGDSLSQGFNNGGIYRTDLNFPAMLAECWEPAPPFRQPNFTSQAGIPLNLEILIRGLSDQYGESIEWDEYLPALSHLYSTLRRIKRYWEGTLESLEPSGPAAPYHNQSVWGFAMNDAWMVTDSLSRRFIKTQPESYSIFEMLPDHAMYLTSSLVLNPSHDKQFSHATQIDNIQYLQEHGGVENLIVTMGHNNIIGAVSDLRLIYSRDEDLEEFPSRRKYTVYRPEHFEKEYRKLAEKINNIGAERVVAQTIPYVTIPPVTRGVNADKSRHSHTGYFDYYTRFWIWDKNFNPDRHPHLTKEQAISLDQHVDEYNVIIRKIANENGWILVPLNQQLSGFARRRLGGKPHLPFSKKFVAAMNRHPMTAHLFEDPDNPKFSTDYLRIDHDNGKIYKGGIFSLDGIHPTTTGYGLIAHIYKRTMEKNGVQFDKSLNWKRIISNDTLITDPPHLLVELRNLLRFLSLDRQQKLSVVGNGLLNQLMNIFSARTPSSQPE